MKYGRIPRQDNLNLRASRQANEDHVVRGLHTRLMSDEESTEPPPNTGQENRTQGMSGGAEPLERSSARGTLFQNQIDPSFHRSDRSRSSYEIDWYRGWISIL